MSVVDQPFSSGSRAVGAEPGSTSEQAPPPQTTPPQTTLPSRSAPRPAQTRRQLVGVRREDRLAIGGAAAAALATTGLLWTQVAPFTGILGYVVVSWLLFVLIYALLVAFDNNRPTVRDRVSSVAVQSLALVVIAALVFIVIYTFFRGWKALVHVNFYTHDLSSTTPLDPLTDGGVLHAIVGTLIEVSIAMGIAVPLGLLAA